MKKQSRAIIDIVSWLCIWIALELKHFLFLLIYKYEIEFRYLMKMPHRQHWTNKFNHKTKIIYISDWRRLSASHTLFFNIWPSTLFNFLFSYFCCVRCRIGVHVFPFLIKHKQVTHVLKNSYQQFTYVDRICLDACIAVF